MFSPRATRTYVETVNSTPPKSESGVVMTGMFSSGRTNRKTTKTAHRAILAGFGRSLTRSDGWR